MSDERDTNAVETRAEKTAAPPVGLRAGDLLGRYEILEPLGGGGMGLLYTAFDTDLHRKVAIKLLRVTKGARAAQARARLLREARAAAQLNHPNVITVYEVGWDRGQDFLAMELVEGVDLERWLRDRDPGGDAAKERSWHGILAAFASAGRGLAAAHQAGLIHRDFKPANVLMGDDGRVLVTDFGLVRQAPSPSQDEGGEDPGESDAAPGAAATNSTDLGQISGKISGLDETLTRTGAIMGTPRYMAPEQFLGEPTDARTDQFSYCVALYEALYGVRPFPGDDREDIQRANLAGDLAAPPASTDVPRAIRSVLERGLSREADQRYASMNDLLDDLERATAKRWPRAVAALGALALFAAGGAWAATHSAEPEPASGPITDPVYIALCAAAGPDHQYPVPEGAGDALRQAFVATDAPGAKVLAETIGSWLDRRWAAWRAAHARLCSGVSADFQPGQAARMARCLRATRGQLGRVSRVLSEPDADTIEGSSKLIYEIELPDCSSGETLPEPPEPSAAPETQRTIEDLRDDMARVTILLGARRWKRARQKAEWILSGARRLDHPGVEAEALVTAAHAQRHRGGDAEIAGKMFREATVVAESTGNHRLLVHALVGQMRVDNRSKKPFDSTALARLRSLLERYGGMRQAGAQLGMLLAGREVVRQELRDAMDQLDRAEESLTDEHLYDRIVLLVVTAHIQKQRHRHHRAVEALQRAYDLTLPLLGPEHFEVVDIVEALAVALEDDNRPEEAREMALRAEAAWRTPRGREYIDETFPAYRAGRRLVRGRVVDSAGRPVPDAEVIIGSNLDGNRMYALAALELSKRVKRSIQRVTSAGDGSFELRVPQRRLSIIAESETERSLPISLESRGDYIDMDLVLHPFGSVRGTLAANPPFRGTQLVELQLTGGRRRYGGPELKTPVEPDGAFSFDRVPAGTYRMRTSLSERYRSEGAGVTELQVVPHRVTQIEIALRDGPIAVDVVMRSQFRTPVSTFGLSLVPGRARLRTLEDFEIMANQRLAGSRLIAFRPVEPRQGASVALEATYRLVGMHPGIHTACSFPMPRNDDPKRGEWLAQITSLQMSCTEIEVAESPPVQSAVVQVTPMRVRSRPEPKTPEPNGP